MGFDDEMRGGLWVNNKKEKDGQPDYTGKVKINGVMFYLSAWEKSGSSGKWFSISVSDGNYKQNRASTPTTPTETQTPTETNGDLSF